MIPKRRLGIPAGLFLVGLVTQDAWSWACVRAAVGYTGMSAQADRRSIRCPWAISGRRCWWQT